MHLEFRCLDHYLFNSNKCRSKKYKILILLLKSKHFTNQTREPRKFLLFVYYSGIKVKQRTCGATLQRAISQGATHLWFRFVLNYFCFVKKQNVVNKFIKLLSSLHLIRCIILPNTTLTTAFKKDKFSYLFGRVILQTHRIFGCFVPQTR